MFIIHVGSVVNKGTHALLKSEISELEKICKNVEIHISTSDVATLRYLEPNLKVHSLLVDIPYERADLMARKGKYSRETLRYKFVALISLFLAFFQAFLSVISGMFMKMNLKPIYRPDVMKRFKDSDLIISTSDENFKEGSVFLPLNIYWKLAWWSILFSRMWDVLIAKKIFRKPIVVFPNSVGPFRTRLGRFMAKISLSNVDLILLREPDSYLLLKDLEIKTPTLITSDVVILLEADGTKTSQPLGRPAIGISPGIYAISLPSNAQREYVVAHSKVLDYLIEKYDFNVFFLPHEVSGSSYDDLRFCKAILQNMTHKDKGKIIVTEKLEEFKNCIRQLDLLVTSRMHPAVMACSDKVPAAVIVYDHKQTGFFRQLGLDSCTINIDQLTYEELLSKVEFVWNNRQNIKDQLKLEIPVLQRDVRTKIEETCVRFTPLGCK